MHKGRPGGPGHEHLWSLQPQDAQVHNLVAGHGAPPHTGRTSHHPREQDMRYSITTILQAQQATLLSPSSAPPPCHLESPAAISCPATRGGRLSLHQGKVNEAAGLSLPCHATWVRTSQSSENPQIWPINPPVAPKTGRSSLLPRWAYLVKGTCTAAYI